MDGHKHYLMGGCNIQRPVEFSGYTTMVFQTRADCRKHIQEHYGYIKHRKDLQAEPHGWKMPRPVQVTVAIQRWNRRGK